MSSLRIVFIIFLHIALITVIPVYYWKVFFPDSQDALLPRILADAIVLLIIYLSIRKWNVKQPDAIKTASYFHWMIMAIFTAILLNSGIYGVNFLSAMLHHGPDIDQLQEAIQTCLGINKTHTHTFDLLDKLYYWIWIGFSGAICEEYLYRRLVLTQFRKYGVLAAMILSGVIFEMVHFERSHTLYHFHIAFWFGILYVFSGKIWVPMLAHFVFNAFHDVQFALFKLDAWSFWLWLYPLCYLLGTVWVIYHLAVLGFENPLNRFICIAIHTLIWLAVVIAGLLGYQSLFPLNPNIC